MKTRQQVLKAMERSGVTVAAWAREHGYRADQVRDVLRGKAKGRFGAAHEIAVRLQIKAGTLGTQSSRAASRKPADDARG